VRAALGASGVMLAALAIGCGATTRNDHDAIEQLWKDYFGAIESGNVGDAAKLYSSACGDVDGQIETLMNALAPLQEDGSVDVTGVEIQNNNGTEAESIPLGTITFRGTQQEIASDAYTPHVKEDGDWKFSNCDILGGGFFEQTGGGTEQ